MFRWKNVIAPVAGLALMLSYHQAQSRAQDMTPAVGKATITVTVVDKDGKPVEGADVGIFPPPAKKHAADPATQPAGADAPAPEKPAKPVAIVSGTTGADGTVALAKVPDGMYVVQAKMKGAGNGREKLTVTDGKDAAVSVTLKARKKAAT